MYGEALENLGQPQLGERLESFSLYASNKYETRDARYVMNYINMTRFYIEIKFYIHCVEGPSHYNLVILKSE